jgi:hypothetical protein
VASRGIIIFLSVFIVVVGSGIVHACALVAQLAFLVRCCKSSSDDSLQLAACLYQKLKVNNMIVPSSVGGQRTNLPAD